MNIESTRAIQSNRQWYIGHKVYSERINGISKYETDHSQRIDRILYFRTNSMEIVASLLSVPQPVTDPSRAALMRVSSSNSFYPDFYGIKTSEKKQIKDYSRNLSVMNDRTSLKIYRAK